MSTKSAVEKLAAASKVAERPNAHFDLTTAVLYDTDQRFEWNIWGSVVAPRLDLTISGASTFTLDVEDPQNSFLNSPILRKWAFGIKDQATDANRNLTRHKPTQATALSGDTSNWEWVLLGKYPIDIQLDEIYFRLAHVKTVQDLLTLTFEDKTASILRSNRGTQTVARGKMTRAGFVAMLCKNAGVDYYIPEINVKQPIATSADVATAGDVRSTGAAGFTTFQGITVKGKAATQGQLDILTAAMQTSDSLSAPNKARIALVAALITENTVANPNPGNSGDEGALSLTTSTAHSMGINPYDVGAVCNAFLTKGFVGGKGAIALANANPTWPAYQIAQACQGSGAGAATNGGSNYGPSEKEATAIVATWGGGGAGQSTATTSGNYQFSTGPNETWWDAIMRLASEVQWYAFVRENRLWYVSGNYLFAQQPQMLVKQGESGIDWVDVDLDIGARDFMAQIDVFGHTDLWTALPGMATTVKDRGPADGTWVCSEIQADLADPSGAAQITLLKPLPARPEPATGSTSPTGPDLGSPGTAQAAFNASQRLSDMKLPYLWGGGHAANGLNGVHAGGPGLDCSGSTCWVLKQAGMFSPSSAIVSGAFNTWGVPGKGKQMTVWYSANHVWIEFNLPNNHAQMNTVSPGSVGPRLYPFGPPGGNTGGFTARHFPGT